MESTTNTLSSEQKAAAQNSNYAGVTCSVEPIFKRRPWLLVVLAVIALMIEVLVFNSSALFFDKDKYQEIELTLPKVNIKGEQKDGFLINQKNKALEINLPNIDVGSIYFTTKYGSPLITDFEVAIKDQGLSYQWARVATGQVLTLSDNEHSSALLKISASGKAKALQLAFTLKGNTAFVITKVVINKAIPFNFSLIRVGLMLGLLMVISVLACGCARNRSIAVDGTLYKRINRAILVVGVLASALTFHVMAPWSASASGFKPIALGILPYSTADGSVLVDLPKNDEEFITLDAFAQQLDAWLKGQLALDFKPDARLQYLDNVYDPSERNFKEVPYLWDRAYYEGHYYSYFGIAPIITTYLPVYLITGKLPCSSLVLFINLLLVVVAFNYLLSRLTSLFMAKVNPLLFLLSKLGALLMTQAFFVTYGFTFYNIAYLSAIGFFCLAIAWSLSYLHFIPKDGSLSCAWLKKLTNNKALLQLFLAGVALVGLVSSRPLDLLFLLCFMVPFFIHLLLSKSLVADKVKSFVVVAVPVVIGAVALMSYNYLRFDSVFEFGQFMQLTVFDTNFHMANLSIERAWTILTHFLWSSFNYASQFPYVLSNSDVELNMGNFSFVPDRSGILAYVFTWSIFLVGMSISRTGLFKPLNAQGFIVRFSDLSVKEQINYLWSVITMVIIVLIPPFLILIGGNAGLIQRYITDVMMVVAVLCFMQANLQPIQNNIHDTRESASFKAMIYITLIVMLLMTLAQGFFLLFGSGTLIKDVNPDFFLNVKEVFSPLSFNKFV